MTSSFTFDVGPLSWVKSEIDLALDRVTQGLQQFGANPSDTTQLKFCRTHLHQVRGALTIVGLDGVTQFTDALEALLTDIEDGRQPADTPRIALIGRALASIRRYLDDLLAGDPNQPLRLFDLYRQLAAARGQAAPSPADLFFPDLTRRPQLPQIQPPADPEAQLRTARTRYQKGLLVWLKAPDKPIGALELKLAAQLAGSSDSSPTLRGFWWAAAGFFTALAERAVNIDGETKSLCSRIDQQLRQQTEGARSVPDKLMRDVLFQIAIARTQNVDVQTLRTAFDLAALIPSTDTQAVSKAAQIEPFLKRMREISNAAEEGWSKFCGGAGQALDGFCDAAAALDQGAERLGNTDFRRLTKAVAATANWVREDRKRQNDSLAMELATGVLLIGNAAENFTHLGSDFVHQVDVMVARLHSCIAGTPLPSSEIPVLDEMTRRAQEKLLIAQVVREIQSSLGQIEQALDTFFREPDQKEQLVSCQKPVKQIVGALMMLGYPDAVAALQTNAKKIAHFASPDYQADHKHFEDVARQLSALGFFVEALQSGPKDFAAFVRGLEIKPSKVEEALATQAGLKKQLQTQVPVPADVSEAPMSPAIEVSDASDESAAKGSATSSDMISGVAPEVPEASLTPPAASVEEPLASAPEVDAELLEIFLEEANEVLETIGAQLDQLRARPSDDEALTTLRRAFHTLKGSSRMVGLGAFGEVAWAVEQVHNLWLRQEKPADATLMRLVEMAREVFSAWVSHLSGGSPLPDAKALVALSDQIKGGETIAAPGRAVPAEAPLAEEVVELVSDGAEEAGEASAPDQTAANFELPPLELETAFETDSTANALTPLSLDAAAQDVVAPSDAVEVVVETPVVLDSDLPTDVIEAVTVDPSAEGVEGPEGALELAAEAPLALESDLPTDVIEAVTVDPSTEGAEVPEGSLELAVEAPVALENDLPTDVIEAVTVDSSAEGVDVPEDSLEMAAEAPLALDSDLPADVTEAVTIDLSAEGVDVPEDSLDLVAETNDSSTEEAVAVEDGDEQQDAFECVEAVELVDLGDDEEPLSLGDSDQGSGQPSPQDAPTEIEAPELVSEGDEGIESIPAAVVEVSSAAGSCVSPALYQIFVEEAQVHLAALRLSFGELEIAPALPTPAEMIRAAHTLGSISGTVGFLPALHLGHGLEAALLKREKSANPRSLEALEVIRSTIAELDQMVDAITRGKSLRNADALVAQLSEIYPLATFGLGDADAPPVVEAGSSAIDDIVPEDEIDNTLLPIFLEEAADLILGINERLAMWAEDAFDTHSIHALTRLLHTLKGSARMTGAMRVGSLAHRLESTVEGAHRAGGADPDLIAALRTDFDGLANLVDQLAIGPANDEIPSELIEAGLVEEETAPQSESVDLSALPLDGLPSDEGAVDEVDLSRALESDVSGVLEMPDAAEFSIDLEAPAELDQAAPQDDFSISLDVPDLPGIDLPEIGLDAVDLDLTGPDLAEEVAPPSAPSAQKEVPPATDTTDSEASLLDLDVLPTMSFDLPTPEPRQSSVVDEPPAPADALDPDLLPIFLEEAVELVKAVYEQLDAWQQAPSDGAASHALARSLHTLKGSARMAGAMTIGALTHTLESRAEEASKSGRASAVLIEEMKGAFDVIANVVEGLHRGESLESMSIELPGSEFPGQLPSASSDVPRAPTLVVGAAHEPAGEPALAAAQTRPADEATVQVPRKDTETKPMLRVQAELIDHLVNDAGELSIARARIEGEMRGLKQSMLDLTENVIRLRRQLREIEIQAESQLQSRTAHAQEAHTGFDPLELDRFTRFQEVTRMMAESVNDVATVQQNLLKTLDEANAALAAQGRLNRELQQTLMSVRMVPFSSVSERLSRIVRQTAKELRKRADLDVFGSNIELDQNVINRMIGPFEHLLRNAIAHGIETPQTRVEHGKSEIGDIRLTLKQEGNEVIITMEDDGAGLNFSSIRDKAIGKGLLTADAPYDERQLTEMIFNSGFSTATQVSQVSGRGVGMDVVMTEVTNLGGRIEVTSVTGKGSVFRIYLPLTLAVTNAVLVRVGSRTYAIPSSMVDQVREVKEDALTEIRAEAAVNWLGNRYAFHFLPHLLGEPGALPEARRMYWLMMLHSGLQRVAIQVDELFGTHEIVVKNIGPQLSRVVGVAGATVLGDGQIVLILNPVALSTRAPVISVGRHAASGAPQAEALAPAVEQAIHLPTILVVDDSLTVRKVTGRLLAREGYQVVTAKDGVDALEQMTEIIPDVILSDIEMPRMDGFELARNIRADERLRGIPVVMISSRTADKHRSHAAELGVNHFLGKPYQEDELLGLIREFLGK